MKKKDTGQTKPQKTYTDAVFKELKKQPADRREMIAAHLLGVIEGVKIAPDMSKTA